MNQNKKKVIRRKLDATNEAKLDSLRAKPARSRKWTGQKWRRFLKLITFFPCVVLPVALAIVYYAYYASDRYVVETKFAIRSPIASAPADLLGMVTGASGSGSTVIDSYMIVDFITSRDLVDQIEGRIDLRAIYDTDKADFLTRFDSSKPQEDFVDYFQRMVSAHFDTSSQIITVEVQAFTPEESKLVAEQILDLSGQLVNQISERVRLDTVRVAEAEVARSEQLLREHRSAISVFREQEQDIDPTRSVEAQQLLLGRLEAELSQARTRMGSIRQFLKEDAPSVKVLESKIEALEFQLEEQRAKLGAGTAEAETKSQTLTALVGAYEELAVDLEFLQRAYVSSLASLEAARLEADRQQRYLASFVLPKMPEKALYPKSVTNVLMIFALSLMGWGIITMFVYVVREHST